MTRQLPKCAAPTDKKSSPYHEAHHILLRSTSPPLHYTYKPHLHTTQMWLFLSLPDTSHATTTRQGHAGMCLVALSCTHLLSNAAPLICKGATLLFIKCHFTICQVALYKSQVALLPSKSATLQKASDHAPDHNCQTAFYK